MNHFSSTHFRTGPFSTNEKKNTGKHIIEHHTLIWTILLHLKMRDKPRASYLVLALKISKLPRRVSSLTEKTIFITLFTFLGDGIGRNDDHVFLFEGDIKMSKNDAINILQQKEKSRHTRAVTSNKQKLWPANVPYVVSSSLCKLKSTMFMTTYSIRSTVLNFDYLERHAKTRTL